MRKNSLIALLATGHACVDIYQGAVAALVPFFVAERAYTYAAASGIVLAASLLSSVAQPLFGVLTDRWRMPWLLPGSTLLGGVGIALSGVNGSYAWTMVFVAISGIGVAAYHPEAARIARTVSRGSHRAMAWFSTGGNIGFALAPLMVGVIIGAGGLSWTPLLVLPAAAGAVMALPVLQALTRRQASSSTGPLAPATDDVPAFIKLTVAVIFRSIAFVGLSTFIALFVEQRLGSVAAGTAALFLLFFGGVVGSILGGYFAQRWGRIAVSRWAYLFTSLAIAGVVWVPGPALYVFVALASCGLYVPFSLVITLGQDYLPTRVGTASGITLGLTVSVGGLVSPALGALADATSLQTALMPLIVMPLVSWFIFATLSDPTARTGSAAGTAARGDTVLSPSGE